MTAPPSRRDAHDATARRPDADSRPDRSPLVPALIGSAVLLALAAISVLAADAAGAGNPVLRDAGLIARTGAPVAALVADLAGAMSLGGALLAGWLLREEADRSRAMLVVAVTAGVTTVARGTALLFSYAIATGQPVGSDRFGSDLSVYLATDLGVWLLTALLVSAAATAVAVTGSSRGLARVVTVMMAAVAFCAAMTGHASGGDTHEVATSTMMVHLLAVGIWLGGLAVLQLLPATSRDDAAVVRGYSHLALIAWIALALSGVWALAVRMNSPAELLTHPYVQLGAAKAVLLLALGAMGALQRRQIATGLARTAADGQGLPPVAVYRRLALMELVLLGLAVSLAAAMSSSPPPAEAVPPPPGPAAVLSGYPLPPAPELTTVLTQWRPDPFGMALACALLLWWWRPAAPSRERAASMRLVGGAALLVLVTSGALNVYAKVLVSAHVLQHVLLLAAGALIGSALTVPAPVRVLVRGRTWLAALVAAAPVALLIAVYAGPGLRVALESHVADLGLQVLALVGGALAVLLVRTVLEEAPAAEVAGKRRRSTVARAPLVAGAPLLLLVIAGIALSTTDILLAASWFGATGRQWWPDALADQRRVGILVTGLAGLCIAAVPAVIQSDRREAANAQHNPESSVRTSNGS